MLNNVEKIQHFNVDFYFLSNRDKVIVYFIRVTSNILVRKHKFQVNKFR